MSDASRISCGHMTKFTLRRVISITCNFSEVEEDEVELNQTPIRFLRGAYRRLNGCFAQSCTERKNCVSIREKPHATTLPAGISFSRRVTSTSNKRSDCEMGDGGYKTLMYAIMDDYGFSPHRSPKAGHVSSN